MNRGASNNSLDVRLTDCLRQYILIVMSVVSVAVMRYDLTVLCSVEGSGRACTGWLVSVIPASEYNTVSLFTVLYNLFFVVLHVVTVVPFQFWLTTSMSSPEYSWWLKLGSLRFSAFGLLRHP